MKHLIVALSVALVSCTATSDSAESDGPLRTSLSVAVPSPYAPPPPPWNVRLRSAQPERERRPSLPDGPTCTASWYGYELAGRPTASGEPFDPEGLTAAMWGVPLGTTITVRHGGQSVTVRVNDRGPAKRLRRCVDLSRAAFAVLAPLNAGLIEVHVEERTEGAA